MRRWAPVVLWAAVIFAFSSVHALSTGLGLWDTLLRKGAHVVEFAVLGALLASATGRLLPAFVLGALYAVSDEVHQHFVPGRNGNALDVAIDAVGVAIGAALFRRARTP